MYELKTSTTVRQIAGVCKMTGTNLKEALFTFSS
jgi:hypothetical protein